ncbi:hypothetical protein E4U58_002068 [Claviceps cyperi]|nr:hypothetical protein E4U58_002068 [Claviceps cyperi]
MRALSLVALLLPLAAARNHKQCDCMSWNKGEDWIHNAMLTHYVCFYYYKDQATFDSSTGRCVASSGHSISGQPWEDNCKYMAASGYFPVDTGANGQESVNYMNMRQRAWLSVGSC